MSAQINIYLLGPPSITYCDKPIKIDRLQNRALLFRLAVQAEPISRDQLTYLFWPDIADSLARRHLTQLLSHVRRVLPEPDLVLTTKSHVQFDQARVWSDVVAFTQLCTRRKDASVESLQQAISLYRGLLMDGVSLPNHPEFETWLMDERYRLERLYLDALDTLATRFSANGEFQKAVELTQRHLDIDELSEEAHRRLIKCYGATGNRGAAIRQYEHCHLILERNLGVEPLPETEAVYQALLARKPLPEITPHKPTWVSLPGPDVPLVGRDRLLAELALSYQRTRTDLGSVVLLTGEAGSGKTRLMQEFVKQVGDDTLILSAACYRPTRSIPFHPIVEALRPALNNPPLDLRVPLSWLGIAASLFPELSDLYPGLPLPTDSMLSQQDQGQLFEAVRLLTLSLADQGTPVLLCLDDLQWADSITLNWLAFLAQKLPRYPVLVIGTYRSENADDLNVLRHELSRQRIVTEYHLTELEKSHVKALLSHFDMADDEGLTINLLRVTGGNPFYLVEMLQQLYEQSQLNMTDNWQVLQLPTGVRETVERRLDRLQPITRQVLEAAAVWGQIFSFHNIQQTSGRNELETADALEELTSRNLIVEDLDGFRFHHEIIQTVLYQTLRTWRRQLLHRRAGEMLVKEISSIKGSGRAAMAARIGQHFAASGDGNRAVDYLLEAGDYARNLYDLQSALDHYQQALVFLQQQGELTRAARTLMKVSQTHHLALEFQEARVALEQGLQLWQRSTYSSKGGVGAPAPHSLRIVWPFVPHLIDSTKVNDSYSSALIEQLFSGLVRLTPELDIIPDVAQDWDIQDGGRRYLFYLRDDVMWSDGQPVTAYDFEYALKRVLDPETDSPAADLLFDICNASAYHTGEIMDPDEVGIHAPDSRTLVFEIMAPTSYFLSLLTNTICFPQPRHIVSHKKMGSIADEGIVSNGAFLLEMQDEDGTIILRRNPDYHNPCKGNVDRVELSALGDRRDIWAMYQADQLDVVIFTYPPSDETDRMRWRYAADYITFPALKTDFMSFDTSQPPFDDVRIRQAFSHAVDRVQLADRVMRGYATPAQGGLVPPGMPGHSADAGAPFDPALARKLLRAAGYQDGSGFPHVEWLNVEGFGPVSSFLQSQWQTHLGLDIEYDVLPWDSFLERVLTNPPQILVGTWVADYPDPDSFLRAGPVQKRYTGWHDEVYNRLLDDARNASDLEERMAICQRIDRMLAEQAVILSLTYVRDHFFVKPWVKFFSSSPVHWGYWQDWVIEDH